jgi:hypothetical protein
MYDEIGSIRDIYIKNHIINYYYYYYYIRIDSTIYQPKKPNTICYEFVRRKRRESKVSNFRLILSWHRFAR